MLLFDPFVPLAMRAPAGGGFLAPADLAVGDDDTVLVMDLPGLTADDLEIEVVDGYLTVRGERSRPEPPEGSAWAHVERTFGSFERRLRLPSGVDPEAIQATVEDGVLSVTVPKPERLKPRTIAIESPNGRRRLETATA